MKNKHKLNWFEKRVGRCVIKNSVADLFNPLIKIESKQHAKALYINQSVGHTYSEV